MQRKKTRTRQLELAAPLAAALCLAGCGSGAGPRAAPPPKLPHSLAEMLAHASDSVADALDTGDGCRALTLAQSLQRHTIAAINAGHVTSALQEPLQTTVNDLAARIQCVPSPQGNAHGKGRGKHKNKHDEGND